MVLIEANKPKKLLHFRYIKHVTRDELLAGRPELDVMLADFPDGFRLLTDLSELDAMDSNCREVIGGIMELLEAKGVQKVVRLIPDPSKDIGLNIMSMFHYSKKVRPIICDTLEEALKILQI